MKPTQRFVAGATCPSCNAIDALLLDSKDQSIECVDCGFTQSAEELENQSAEQSNIVKAKPAKVKPTDIIQIVNKS